MLGQRLIEGRGAQAEVRWLHGAVGMTTKSGSSMFTSAIITNS